MSNDSIMTKLSNYASYCVPNPIADLYACYQDKDRNDEVKTKALLAAERIFVAALAVFAFAKYPTKEVTLLTATAGGLALSVPATLLVFGSALVVKGVVAAIAVTSAVAFKELAAALALLAIGLCFLRKNNYIPYGNQFSGYLEAYAFPALNTWLLTPKKVEQTDGAAE